MEYTAEALLSEVQGDFLGRHTPPTDYLLSEYAALLTSLVLSLPGSDGECVLTAENGKLPTDIAPQQVRRVFCGETELLRGSAALLALLPSAPVYCPTADGIAVNTDGEHTVYYRKLPAATLTEPFPLDIRYLPMMRAYLAHRTCLYIGDTVGADVYGAEYNRMLADFQAENGVRV